jgi:uncharacterized protein
MDKQVLICNLIPSEFFALLAFILFNVGITLWGSISLFVIFRRLKAAQSASICRSTRSESIALSLFAVQVACIAYAFFVEPYQLEVTKVSLFSSKLKGLTQPIRLVHISDIHSDPFPRLETRLPDEINKLNPDLIVFSGDAINSKESLEVFRSCITRIAKVAPTFVASGNHDSRAGRNLNIFGDTGVSIVNCESSKIECKRNSLTISGIPVDGEQCFKSVLQTLPRDSFNIVLYHYPSAADMISKYEVDLLCAGHTHGGQVRMPFYGAIITRSLTGKKFEGGQYDIGKMHLSVNRGIGMVGNFVPRLRFLCKPEITLIELNGE